MGYDTYSEYVYSSRQQLTFSVKNLIVVVMLHKEDFIKQQRLKYIFAQNWNIEEKKSKSLFLGSLTFLIENYNYYGKNF